jgi:beta-1,4-mannosyl-glycoprotein beta-1,4-N-acetylglucosaminyltransferase
MTVYDCFPFFNENDLLELRINQHWGFVDKFIIIEAGETHTGLKKPFNFDHERFEKYSSKLIYRKFDTFEEEMKKKPHLVVNYDMPGHMHTSDWIRDSFQGNYEVEVLNEIGAKDDDIVYNSSLDEILNDNGWNSGLSRFSDKDRMYTLKSGDSIVCTPEGEVVRSRPIFGFGMDMYVYKYNLFCKKIDVGQMCEFSFFKGVFPPTARHLSLHTDDAVKNAGWHFTFLDDTDGEKVLQKQKSWAHSRDVIQGQKVKFEHSTKEEALQRLFFDYQIKKIDISESTHPKYLIDNLEKYKGYIY